MESVGAETESLFTGPEALKTVDSAARVEILHLFPELASIDYDRLPEPVRPILSGRQGRKLANRHANNKKHLAQSCFAQINEGPSFWAALFCG